jgi:hypothetical protein
MSEKSKKYEELRRQIDAEIQEAVQLSDNKKREIVAQWITTIKQHSQSKEINSLHYAKLINQLADAFHGDFAAMIDMMTTTPEQQYLRGVQAKAIAHLIGMQLEPDLIDKAVRCVPSVRPTKEIKGGDPELQDHVKCMHCGRDLCSCGRCHMLEAKEDDPRCPARQPEKNDCMPWILAHQTVWHVLNSDMNKETYSGQTSPRDT